MDERSTAPPTEVQPTQLETDIPRPDESGVDPLSRMLRELRADCSDVQLSTLPSPGKLAGGHGAPALYALLEGRAWLGLDGDPGAGHWLEAGDVALVSAAAPHHLAHERGASWATSEDLPARSTDARSTDARSGASELVRVFSAGLELHPRALHPLFSALPAVVLARAGDARCDSWRAGWLAAVAAAAEDRELGARAMLESLVRAAVIGTVRLHVTASDARSSGWLRALLAPELGPALLAMHAKPEQKWTLRALAHEAGMSRSVFAERFTREIGRAPGAYLFDCRMQRAAALLLEKRLASGQLARAVGYSSEAAFCTAFKRWAGMSPTLYRRARATR